MFDDYRSGLINIFYKLSNGEIKHNPYAITFDFNETIHLAKQMSEFWGVTEEEYIKQRIGDVEALVDLDKSQYNRNVYIT